MTRSMIGELFTPEQVQDHLRLIESHLSFPDGVRLTNKPVSYQGGVRVLFRRAEESAHFGREIGLQYVQRPHPLYRGDVQNRPSPESL